MTRSTRGSASFRSRRADEGTILGRGVLYLALTASIAAIVGGLWFGAVRLGSSRFGPLPPSRRRLDEVRELLGDCRFAYYCFKRCKFQPLPESTLAD